MSETSALEKVERAAEVMAQVVLLGDLSRLAPQDKVKYYSMVCEAAGLDPALRPFAYLRLNGREILYADKGCAEQLRAKNGISVRVTDAKTVEGVYVVTVEGTTREGRVDSATGAVTIKGLSGDNLANALMKAETKAKRRLTLSMCGLGMLDDSEVETIRGAERVDVATTDTPRSTASQPAAPQAGSTQAPPPQAGAGNQAPAPATPAAEEPLDPEAANYCMEVWDATATQRGLDLEASHRILERGLARHGQSLKTMTQSRMDAALGALNDGKLDAAINTEAQAAQPPAAPAPAAPAAGAASQPVTPITTEILATIEPKAQPYVAGLDNEVARIVGSVKDWESFNGAVSELVAGRGINEAAIAHGLSAAAANVGRGGEKAKHLSKITLQTWAAHIAHGWFDWNTGKLTPPAKAA